MKPHTPWMIASASFYLTGGILWCCDQRFIAFIVAIAATILLSNGLDEYERPL